MADCSYIEKTQNVIITGAKGISQARAQVTGFSALIDKFEKKISVLGRK